MGGGGAQGAGAGRRRSTWARRSSSLRCERARRAAGPSTPSRRTARWKAFVGRRTSSRRRRCASWWTASRRESAERASRPRTLRYRDFLTVALILEGPRPVSATTGSTSTSPSVKVGRVQNFKSWSPEMVPDRDGLLRPRVLLLRGRRPVERDRRRADRAGQEGAGQDRPGRPRTSIDGCVVRQPKAYPVYDDDYAGTSTTIRTELAAKFPTLHLVGRNGMHKYNNQDHAMMTAMLTVREHRGRRDRLRRVARQPGRRVPRGRRSRRARGARQRAAGAAPAWPRQRAEVALGQIGTMRPSTAYAARPVAAAAAVALHGWRARSR